MNIMKIRNNREISHAFNFGPTLSLLFLAIFSESSDINVYQQLCLSGEASLSACEMCSDLIFTTVNILAQV